ncbi:MAG: hypothetical protein ACK5LO_11260 [Leucobacter sp.]
MSEQERPLTRRERRLREMAETGALDLSGAAGQGEAAPAAAEPAAPAEIEISPFNEDGTPRSRREMRQLREAALAESGAARSTEDAATPPAATDGAVGSGVDDEDVVTEDTEPMDAEELAGARRSERATPQLADPVVPDFDTLIAPPTEPFTVDDIREAEQVAAEASSEAAAIAEATDGDQGQADASAAPGAEPDAAAAPEKPKRRFWKRGTDAGAAAGAPAAAEAGEAAEAAPTSADAVTQAAPEQPVSVSEPSAPSEVPAAPEAAAPNVAVPETPVAKTAPEPVSAPPAEKETYSFPDIQPPEEWRSVFDEPATSPMPQAQPAGNGNGDFDDLISRAVAQEGPSGGANTSALILPAMPDDTGGLAGPLGGTGELYVTGSVKLPKSLGETGGHAALHDSVDIDPIVGELPPDPHLTGEAGPAPVSARYAVSARANTGIPIVAKPAKERSKLPLVLSLTGGGLLIAVAGLAAWGASNGMFG